MAPTDSNGVYSLPDGYEAVNGEDILPSQHNPPLEDLSAAMTGRLPRSGAAPMTGPLKLTDGTAAAPSVTFASAPSFGFFKTANGIGVSISGSQIGEFTALGFGNYIGEVRMFAGVVAPTGWMFCFGTSLLRASYPALFTAIGTAYGAADGTHFSIPNFPNRFPVGAGSIYDPGDFGGAAEITLTSAQMPVHSHGVTQNPHDHGVSGGTKGSSNSNSGVFTGTGSPGDSADINVETANADITINNAGGGDPHSNIPPYLGIHFIIFTGVA